MPFCLEMLTFGHPESSRHTFRHTLGTQPTRGGHMATRTMPFCLEMLTFGHPESSRGLHLATQRAPAPSLSSSLSSFPDALQLSPALSSSLSFPEALQLSPALSSSLSSSPEGADRELDARRAHERDPYDQVRYPYCFGGNIWGIML